MLFNYVPLHATYCRILYLILLVPFINKALARSLGMCLGEDVVVLIGYTLNGPTIFPNYIPRSPLQPHKLLLPNHNPCTGPCKWQPPRPPFASALVTDWYQYSGCSPCMRVAPLYKRADSPGPLLTFWLNVIPVTSRSKTRNLTLTLTRLLVHTTHSLIPYFTHDLHRSTRSPAVAGDLT